MPRTDRARRGALALLAGALLAGCGSETPAEDPPGAWWVARSASAHALFGELAQLEGTPLGRRARELAGSLPECGGAVGIHAPDGDLAKLVAPASCLEDDAALAQALARSGGDLAFALPTETGWFGGSLARGGDELVVDLHWAEPPRDGALALLVPGVDPAGPDRLASAERLVHLRVRPRAGIDFPSLAPADSQADQLFRLGSGIFASTVLDGTWEAAAYLPERAGQVPDIALALGFTLRSAAISAAERTLSDLQKTWPVRRTNLRLPGADGACLPDLNVLPGLAPCYVATRDTLFVGWNRASLERALAGAAAPTEAPIPADEPARFAVDLELVQQADTLVARHVPGSLPALSWPWTRIAATASALGDVVALRVTLATRPRSAS